MTKRCPRCQADRPVEDFPPNRARHDGRACYCRDCQAAANAEWQQRLRLAVVELLGGQCAACGISDARVLCIDHVEGGGTQARKTSGSSRLYRRILGGEPGFQLLCWNCNHLKRIEEGEHVGNRVYPRGVRTGWVAPPVAV